MPPILDIPGLTDEEALGIPSDSDYFGSNVPRGTLTTLPSAPRLAPIESPPLSGLTDDEARSEPWAFSDKQPKAEIQAAPDKTPTGVGGFFTGFGQQIKRTKWSDPIPFVGGGMDFARALTIYNSARRLQAAETAGVEPDSADLQTLKTVWDENQRQSQAKGAVKIGQNVAGILVQLPAFALELVTTGGLYTAGRAAGGKAAIKVMEKVVENAAERAATKYAARVAGGVVGSAFQFPVAGVGRIAAETTERMTPKFEVGDDAGKLRAVIAEEADDFLPALAKALGNQYIEVLSEHSGGLAGEALGKLPGAAALRKMKEKVVGRWFSTHPSSTVDTLLKNLRERGAWHGMLNEMIEERLGEIGRIPIEGYRPPDREQLIAEAIGFSIPGAAAYAARKLTEDRPPPSGPPGGVPISIGKDDFGRDIIAAPVAGLSDQMAREATKQEITLRRRTNKGLPRRRITLQEEGAPDAIQIRSAAPLSVVEGAEAGPALGGQVRVAQAPATAQAISVPEAKAPEAPGKAEVKSGGPFLYQSPLRPVLSISGALPKGWSLIDERTFSVDAPLPRQLEENLQLEPLDPKHPKNRQRDMERWKDELTRVYFPTDSIEVTLKNGQKLIVSPNVDPKYAEQYPFRTTRFLEDGTPAGHEIFKDWDEVVQNLFGWRVIIADIRSGKISRTEPTPPTLAPRRGAEPAAAGPAGAAVAPAGITSPIRENGARTSIVLSDGTAIVGGRFHGETAQEAIRLGFVTDAQLAGGIAAFTRPDGTSWDLQGKPVEVKLVKNLSEAFAGGQALAVGKSESSTIAQPSTIPVIGEKGARETVIQKPTAKPAVTPVDVGAAFMAKRGLGTPKMAVEFQLSKGGKPYYGFLDGIGYLGGGRVSVRVPKGRRGGTPTSDKLYDLDPLKNNVVPPANVRGGKARREMLQTLPQWLRGSAEQDAKAFKDLLQSDGEFWQPSETELSHPNTGIAAKAASHTLRIAIERAFKELNLENWDPKNPVHQAAALPLLLERITNRPKPQEVPLAQMQQGDKFTSKGEKWTVGPLDTDTGMVRIEGGQPFDVHMDGVVEIDPGSLKPAKPIPAPPVPEPATAVPVKPAPVVVAPARARFRELMLAEFKRDPNVNDTNSPVGRAAAQRAFAQIKKEMPWVQNFGDLDKTAPTAKPAVKPTVETKKPEPVVEAKPAVPKLRPGEKGTGDLLQGPDVPFNLAGETAVDTARIAAEKAAAEKAKAEAKAAADKAQQGLFAPKPPEPKPTRTPEQTINDSLLVVVSGTAIKVGGATQLRMTDSGGRKSVQPIASFKLSNPFYKADVKKLEAGSIGKDKQFIPSEGELTVEDKTKGEPDALHISEERTDAERKRGQSPVEPVPNLGPGLAEGRGMSADEARAAVAGEPTAGFEVEFILQVQAEAITGKPEARGYGGFFWKGKIYLVHENMAKGDIAAAKELLREEVGHGLLRTEEGGKQLQAVLDAGRLQLTDTEKQALRDQGYGEANLLDEFIAKSARENLPWWKASVEQVKVWLSKVGLANLTNEETARLLLKNIRRASDLNSAARAGETLPELAASGSRDLDYDAMEDFIDRHEREVINLVEQVRDAKAGARVHWQKVPAARLKKIWLDFGKSGVVRDEKGMQDIADLLLSGIARLKAATELMGHERVSPEEVAEGVGLEWTPKMDERATDFFTDERGNWTLSDYGMGPLERLYSVLFNAETAEQQLYAADKILNVVHQRSDLAALFVEGGSETLRDVANQGGILPELAPGRPSGEKQGEQQFDNADDAARAELKRSRSLQKAIKAGIDWLRKQPGREFNEVEERTRLMDLLKPEADTLAAEPELKAGQVYGGRELGAKKQVEKIAATRKIIKEQFFNGAAADTPEHTEKAWDFFNQLLNPQLSGSLGLKLQAATGAEMSRGLLENELFLYSLRKAVNGDLTMMNAIVDNHLKFSMGGADSTLSTFGRGLRAAAEGSTYWRNALDIARERNKVLAKELGFSEPELQEIIDELRNLQPDVEELERNLAKGDIGGIPLRKLLEGREPTQDELYVILSKLIFPTGITPVKLEQLSDSLSKRIMGQFPLAEMREFFEKQGAAGLARDWWQLLAGPKEQPGALWSAQAAIRSQLGQILREAMNRAGLGEVKRAPHLSSEQKLAMYLGDKEMRQKIVEKVDAEVRAELAKRKADEIKAAGDKAKIIQVREAIEAKYEQLEDAWIDATSSMLVDSGGEALLGKLIRNKLKEQKVEWARVFSGEFPQEQVRQKAVDSVIEDVLKVSNTGRPQDWLGDVRVGLETMFDRIAATAQNRMEMSLLGRRALEQLRLTGQPDRLAEALLAEYAKTQSDTPEGAKPYQKNEVREAFKGYLSGDVTADEFRATLESVGVSKPKIENLLKVADRELKSRELVERYKAMEQAAQSGKLKGLIAEILATPYRAQQDPQWRQDVAERFFTANGLDSGQTKEAAELFSKEFGKRLAAAGEKLAERLLSHKEAPKNRQEFINALRAGLLDPSKPWMDRFLEKTKWRAPTVEQTQRLAELDLKLAEPDLTPREVAETTSKMMGIYRAIGLPPHVLEYIAANVVVTNLTGLKTLTVNVLAPLSEMFLERGLMSLSSPLQLGRVWNGFGTRVVNMFRESRYVLSHDAYTFGRNELAHTQDAFKHLWEQGLEDWNSGDAVRKARAVPRLLFGSQQYVMRTLNALDQASAIHKRESGMGLYGHEAFKLAGLSAKKTDLLIDGMDKVKNAAYQDAIDNRLTKNEARVEADHAAFRWADLFIRRTLRNQVGTKEAGRLANEVLKSAENDAYSIVGRLAKGMEEVDEGGIGSSVMNIVLRMSGLLRADKGMSPAVAVWLFGYVAIPWRTARFYAWNSPYGLARIGIERFRKSQGWEPWYKQSLGTELQERHRLKMALSSTFAFAALTAAGILAFGHSSDDDAGTEDYGVYVTGDGPKNRELKDTWRKHGYRSQSVTVVVKGQKITMPLTRVGEPFAHLFWVLAAHDDYLWRKKEALGTGRPFDEGAIEMAGAGFSELWGVLGQRGIFQTIGNIAKIGGGQGSIARAVTSLGSSMAASVMMPYLGLQRSITGMMMGQVDRSSITANITANMGVLGAFSGNAALNRFGDKLGDRTWYGLIADTGVPMAFRIDADPQEQRFYTTLMNKGVSPPQLRRYLKEESFGPITDEDWNQYVQLSGNKLSNALIKNQGAVSRMSSEDAKKWLAKEAQKSDHETEMILGLERVKPLKQSVPAAPREPAKTRLFTPPFSQGQRTGFSKPFAGTRTRAITVSGGRTIGRTSGRSPFRSYPTRGRSRVSSRRRTTRISTPRIRLTPFTRIPKLRLHRPRLSLA